MSANPDPSPRDRICVYARVPRLGEVKTRLAARVGAPRALRLYRAFLTDCIAAARSVGVEVRVSVAGDPADPTLREIVGDLVCERQAAGDLGERMAATFAAAAEQGIDRLAIVGSDHPTVTASDLRACLEAVDDGTLVLAPTDDGGYWCVAGPAGARAGAAFRPVQWSTPSARTDTARNARAAGLTIREGPPGADVDEAEDLEALRHRLPALPASVAAATRRALAASD